MCTGNVCIPFSSKWTHLQSYIDSRDA
jgi:hypothetical protein